MVRQKFMEIRPWGNQKGVLINRDLEFVMKVVPGASQCFYKELLYPGTTCQEFSLIYNQRTTVEVEIPDLQLFQYQVYNDRINEIAIRNKDDQQTQKFVGYKPCDHKGPCTSENCSCMKNGCFCDRLCSCYGICTNIHLGC